MRRGRVSRYMRQSVIISQRINIYGAEREESHAPQRSKAARRGVRVCGAQTNQLGIDWSRLGVWGPRGPRRRGENTRGALHGRREGRARQNKEMRGERARLFWDRTESEPLERVSVWIIHVCLPRHPTQHPPLIFEQSIYISTQSVRRASAPKAERAHAAPQLVHVTKGLRPLCLNRTRSCETRPSSAHDRTLLNFSEILKHKVLACCVYFLNNGNYTTQHLLFFSNKFIAKPQ